MLRLRLRIPESAQADILLFRFGAGEDTVVVGEGRGNVFVVTGSERPLDVE